MFQLQQRLQTASAAQGAQKTKDVRCKRKGPLKKMLVAICNFTPNFGESTPRLFTFTKVWNNWDK